MRTTEFQSQMKKAEVRKEEADSKVAFYLTWFDESGHLSEYDEKELAKAQHSARMAQFRIELLNDSRITGIRKNAERMGR